MAQASFVIIEVAEYATMVEIEGIFWYHVGSSLSLPDGRKQSGQHTWQGVLPFHCSNGMVVWICVVNAPALGWRSYLIHSCLLCVENGHFSLIDRKSVV